MIDIRNFFYRTLFKLKQIPDIKNVKEPLDPNKNVLIPETYMMNNITIGNLPYKKNWEKTYQKGIDPDFRPSLPWYKDLSSIDNLIQDENGIQIIARKESGYGTHGILWSNFKFKYGFIRAKIKLPSVYGAFAAFWTFGGTPESDIFEHCGNWNNKVSVTHHWGFDYGERYGKKSTTHNSRMNKKFKPTEKFYIYEIEINPYKLIWRINGIKVRVMKKGIPGNDNHIIINVGKGCGVNKFDSLSNDAIMNVEWLKIYRTDKPQLKSSMY